MSIVVLALACRSRACAAVFQNTQSRLDTVNASIEKHEATTESLMTDIRQIGDVAVAAVNPQLRGIKRSVDDVPRKIDENDRSRRR